LSGGNQQKVLLGRWLYKKSKLLLLDQPTRGVDVGAKREIYQMIRDLTREGMAIILISDERSELIGLANRILVFSEGTLTKEFQCDAEAKPDENDIIRYM
jgi:ribose transport system ATP-binding protein